MEIEQRQRSRPGRGRARARRKARLLPAIAITAGLAAVAGCSSSGGGAGAGAAASAKPTTTTATPTARSTAHRVPATTTWLCRPGLPDNPCATPTTATVVSASGAGSVAPAAPAAVPPIDCFYVYPTVSGQKTVNANLHIDPEERAIAVQQASRFAPRCRIFAPMYRQVTLAAAFGTGGRPAAMSAAAGAKAFGDVQAAWREYLADDNDGRGVVLIGHSQGSGMLIQLIKADIDNNPAVRRQLVSALLIGGNVTVPVGKEVGGDFAHVPACRAPGQIGCVVAYSSFLETPPTSSIFGRVVGDPTRQVLCTNPAALAGGSGALESYFASTRFPGQIGALPSVVPAVATPWAEYPDLYRARCETAGGASFLHVTTLAAAGDRRPRVTEAAGPALGLHLYDINLTYGNLVDLVGSQSAVYAKHG